MTNAQQPTPEHSTQRYVVRRFRGVPTTDGAGVKLTRIIGSSQLDMLDPFLLFDCFASDRPQDYLGGFPEHPHRGFETVTYLLHGRMRHKDSAGHEGVVEPGGVQWMTAGSGILHAEMPEQVQGLLKGFQLWVNLPASAKMTAPVYQEFPAETTPLERRDNGTQIRVIAGQTDLGTRGAITNDYVQPTYMDISLPANTQLQQTLPQLHNAFVYLVEGEIHLDGKPPHSQDDGHTHHSVHQNELGILSKGKYLRFSSGTAGARLLLLAGLPLQEPVARAGPFVMNTPAEISQAFADYNNGLF